MQVLARKGTGQFYTDIENAEALKALGYSIYAQISYELSDAEIQQCAQTQSIDMLSDSIEPMSLECLSVGISQEDVHSITIGSTDN